MTDSSAATKGKPTRHLTLPIRDLMDSVGAGRIEKTLQALAGVHSAGVNLAAQTVGVTFDPAQSDTEQLIAAVRASGYDVPTGRVTFGIEGMHCAACVARVEKALARAPGVVGSMVNLARSEGAVETVGDVTVDTLVTAVAKAGYTLVPGDQKVSLRQAREQGVLKFKLVWAVVFTLPLFVLAMLEHVGGISPVRPDVSAWLQFALATPVQFWAGGLFYRRFIRSIRFGNIDMDTLVVLGTSTAYGYSAYVLLSGAQARLHGGVYFETAAVIITLVLFGRYLELSARQRTGSAIEELATALPKYAVVRRGEDWLEVDRAEVKPGDEVLVRKGDQVPVDGELQSEHAVLTEALITGESTPAEKKNGAGVFAGTLNTGEALVMRARSVGSETALAGMVSMVMRAQASKARIQRLADRIAAVFVPVVLGIAALSLILWLVFSEAGVAYALGRAVAVMIIACPCALGLATPTAIAVASGRGAQLGILFADAGALERALKIDAVLLDKTGTLTEGQPVVAEIRPAGNQSAAEVLSLAAAVLEHSGHPLARALLTGARERHTEWSAGQKTETVTGRGVRGKVDGEIVLAGNRDFLTDSGVADLPSLADVSGSLVLVAREREYVGCVILTDRVRTTATAAVRALQSTGVEAELVSGDREAEVTRVAEAVGIARVRAAQTPAAKVARVAALQREGKRVAFLGDGINDAPALAQADLGVAIGSGTAVAAEAAAVTLMTADLRAFVDALDLARRTVRTIHWNLFWAFGYNIVGIPLAAGAFVSLFGWALNPMFAALAMSFSSVLVVSNSLLLRRFQSRFPGRR